MLILFFVISFSFNAVSSFEENELEEEIKKLTHYAEEYETGNINYAGLLLYVSATRENLNEILGAKSRFEGGLFDRESLERVFGEPSEETKWVWVEREDREKKLDEEVPVWRKIVYDGKKIQIRLEAFPSIFIKNRNHASLSPEDEEEFDYEKKLVGELEKEFDFGENGLLVYRLHFSIEYKTPAEELNIEERIGEIKELAEAFDSDPSKDNAEKLAEESVNVERTFESYYRQSSLQCTELMNSIFGAENKRGTQKLLAQEFTFFEGDDFEARTRFEMCEECDWNWINFNIWTESRGRGFFEEESFREISKEKFMNLNFEDFERETVRLLEELRGALQDRDFKKVSEIKSELQALNWAWDEKANNVWEEVDETYKSKRESMSEEERREYNENYGWIKDEQERRAKEKELRKRNLDRRANFYNGLFAGYDKKEFFYTQEEYEKRLVEKFKEFGEEICDNNKDDNNNEFIDCQEDQCGGKICGSGEVEKLIGNGTIKQKVDFYCIEKICQPKEEEIKIEGAISICGNHICEEGENESCLGDCAACEEHEAIECAGRVIFKGKDEKGCNLEPVCLEEGFCESNEDCAQPLCGVAECVENKCQFVDLVECREPECIDGEEKIAHCGNGESVVEEECIEGVWSRTGLECEGETISPIEEVEDIEEEQAGCEVRSDCGGENDVCSNGACVTLPETIEEISPPAENLESAEEVDEEEFETEPEEESKEVEEEETGESASTTGNVIFSFFGALINKLGLTGFSTGGQEAPSESQNAEESAGGGESESPADETSVLPEEESRVEEPREFEEDNDEEREDREEEEGERRESGCREGCDRQCYDAKIRPCAESCIRKECGEELECNVDEVKEKCESGCEEESSGCSDECFDNCLEGKRYDVKFEGEGERRKEEKGVFNIGGTCRTSKGKEEAFIWFGGWGEPFGKIQELKNKYYQRGSSDWCKRELESLINQRREFEKSFNEDFVKWFFEKHLPSNAEDWESKVSGIFELYWKDVDLSRQMVERKECLKNYEFPQPNLINVKYDTEYGSLEFWEEVKTARLHEKGEEVNIISPYMRVWIFPPKEFIKYEMKKAMENHEFPGPSEESAEREFEGGPTEEEREFIKMDKKFMKKIQKLSEKYGGSVDLAIQFKDYETDEIVFNLYAKIDEENIVNIKPMLPSEVPEQDIAIIIDFERIYELVHMHEKEIRGARTESPPWDRQTGLRPKVKEAVDGVKMFFKIRGIVNSAEIQPETAKSDVKSMFNSFILMMMRGDEKEKGEFGEIDKESEGEFELDQEELPEGWESKEILTGEVIKAI